MFVIAAMARCMGLFLLSLLAADGASLRQEAAPHRHPHLQGCTNTTFKDEIAKHVSLTPRHHETRVLVTGAAGFIGSHVALFCQTQLKFHVVAVDDLSGGFMENVAELTAAGGVFVKGSVSDEAFVKRLFAEQGPFRYVYHLAAYAAEGLSHFIRLFNYRNNLEASIMLINEAVKQEPMVQRFVFTSSIAAFGPSNGQLPMTELSPQYPEDPYGISKLAVEYDLRAALHMFGLNYVIFRPHNVYGPGQNIADKFRNVLGIFMNQVLNGEPLTVFGDGSQRRSFSHVDDVAPIIAASVLFERALNNDYFVGTDDHFSVNDVAELVLKVSGSHLPGGDIKHLDARKEVLEATASHEKLRCHFNPPKTTPLSEGVEKMWSHVKNKKFVPVMAGYEQIEVRKNMPPSWDQWLNRSKVTKENALSDVEHLARWRNNNYIRDDGYLPYARCNANQFFPGASKLFSTFRFDEIVYDMMITAVSIKGSSDVSGKPTGLTDIEIATFYKPSGSHCVHLYGHCVLPQFPKKVNPKIMCSIGNQAIVGKLNFYSSEGMKKHKDKIGVFFATISCPFSTVALLTDSFVVNVQVGDMDTPVSVDVCYEYVKNVEEVSICSQPHFGISNKKNDFFFGNPPYGSYNLLDSYLVFHTELMGAKVTFMDLYHESAEYMQVYNDGRGRIMYRDGWNPYNETESPYSLEVYAESSCMLEERIRSRWVMNVHAVDNYVFPSNPNTTLVSVLHNINQDKIFSASVPINVPKQPADPKARVVKGNMLQRWNLLSRKRWAGPGRFTPFGNPRKSSHSEIHAFILHPNFDKSGSLRVIGPDESISDLKLFTVHAMALSRPALDDHIGVSNKWYTELGNKLETALLSKKVPTPRKLKAYE